MSILKRNLEFCLPTASTVSNIFQLLFKRKDIILLACFVFFLAACKDDKSEVEETIVMKTPTADVINISENPDGTILYFSWHHVAGAGGYQFSLYIVNEAGEILEVVGEENEVVTGISTNRPLKMATYYKMVLKTLGSEAKNTADALESTIIFWDNVPPDLPPGAIFIPRGTNLTRYFMNNPVHAQESDADVLYYALIAGGNYTMGGVGEDDNLYMGLRSVEIFGTDKNNLAKIKVVNGAFVSDGGGLILKNLELDYSEFVSESATTTVLLMNPTRNPEATTVQRSGRDDTFVPVPMATPVGFISCKITRLRFSLFFDGNNAVSRYLVGHFLIDDCIIGYDVDNYNAPCLRFDVSLPKDITIKNSTFYNEKILQINVTAVDEYYQLRLLRVSESSHAAQFSEALPDWTGGNLLITNCTFYQFSKGRYPCIAPIANGRGGAQAFNFVGNNGASTPFAQTTDTKTVTNCVIVDSFEWNERGGRIPPAEGLIVPPQKGGGNCFVSRLFMGNAVRIADNNTYWHNDAFHPSNVMATPEPGATNQLRDASDTYIETDPELIYLGNGQFTMTGAEQIARSTGDPRWLNK